MNDFRPCRPAIFYKHCFKIIFKKCIMYLLFSKRNKGTNNDNHSIRLGGKTIWLRLLFRQKSRPKKKKWGEKKSSHNEEERKKDTINTPSSIGNTGSRLSKNDTYVQTVSEEGTMRGLHVKQTTPNTQHRAHAEAVRRTGSPSRPTEQNIHIPSRTTTTVQELRLLKF